MAIKRVSTMDDGVNLELSADEYITIKRALAKALVRAREVEATADESDLTHLMVALEPAHTNAIYCDGPEGWSHDEWGEDSATELLERGPR